MADQIRIFDESVSQYVQQEVNEFLTRLAYYEIEVLNVVMSATPSDSGQGSLVRIMVWFRDDMDRLEELLRDEQEFEAVQAERQAKLALSSDPPF